MFIEEAALDSDVIYKEDLCKQIHGGETSRRGDSVDKVQTVAL